MTFHSDTTHATDATRADATHDSSRLDDPRVERTHAAVIDAASALLIADGPGAITHANVAAAANVSRTTVYTHWPTREDLLRATIDSIGREKPRVDELTGVLRTDLETLLQPIVRDLADDQRAPMVANMIERALHDREVVAIRNEFVGHVRDALAQIIATAVDHGDLRPDLDVDRAMASLLGQFVFVRFLTSDPVDGPLLDAVIDDFVTNNAPR